VRGVAKAFSQLDRTFFREPRPELARGAVDGNQTGVGGADEDRIAAEGDAKSL
jgi:hypothetical protein